MNDGIDIQTMMSSLIFCSSVQDIRAQAQWDGVDGSSRQQLLVDLQGNDEDDVTHTAILLMLYF